MKSESQPLSQPERMALHFHSSAPSLQEFVVPFSQKGRFLDTPAGKEAKARLNGTSDMQDLGEWKHAGVVMNDILEGLK